MSTMQYRRLGRSGLEVSVLCLGTMTFGDRTDEAEAQRIVDAAHDAGVNFIDTADTYVQGRLRAHRRRGDRREPPATGSSPSKVGNPVTGAPHEGGLSRRWILQACDDSLARLGTDWIDLYYLHRDDWRTPIAETVGAIGELLRAGKIRYFGAVELPRVAHRRGRCASASARACRRRSPASRTTTC